MINYLKYCFWCQVSHQHHLALQRLTRKAMHHMRKFDEVQRILDNLHEEICKKHPELRDEA